MMGGSAPRVRGTGSRERSRCRRERFSPARAGNSTGITQQTTAWSVQPRACGEQRIVSRARRLNRGSAPRVRGTVMFACLLWRPGRFSPARAGNRQLWPCHRAYHAVQPRACGEQAGGASLPSASSGSAPRVRGTEPARTNVRRWSRFSPARAGNSAGSATQLSSPPVQPRACGEQDQRGNVKPDASGSAPRVRGTAARILIWVRGERFSPARAGNSRRRPRPRPRRTVQPRACGEQAGRSTSGWGGGGSAPRVRGTVVAASGCARRCRFSPARAGNRSTPKPLQIVAPVQPRACGEQGLPPKVAYQHHGSAPRVRGTGRVREIPRSDLRFSPARAGNRPTCMTLISRAFHDVKERTKMNNSFISLLLPRMSQRLCLWRARRNSRFVGGWRRKTHERKAIEIDWLASIDAYGLKFETAVGR